VINRIDGQHRDLYLDGASAMGLSFGLKKLTLWAGTNRGVDALGKREVVEPSNACGDSPAGRHSNYGGPEKGVWLIDAHKVSLPLASGRITDFSNEPLLKGNQFCAARGDGRGKVWFGLYEGGVVVFDGNRFHAYSETDGLAGGSVNAVHIDDKAAVWIGTERGLSRLEGQKFVTWNMANGLPGERVLWILSDTRRANLARLQHRSRERQRSELDRAAREPSHPRGLRLSRRW